MIGAVQAGFGAAQRDVRNNVYPEFVLGFTAYPGTLNVRTAAGALAEFGRPDKILTGPECPLWLWRASINDVDAWVMHPARPPALADSTLAEVLAPVNLRAHLGLVNGAEVEVTPR